MTWNYRQNGEWKTATIKRREGEKWVPLLDAGGSGTEKDGQGATHGSRNGTTYQASDFGSSESDLQSAFNALSPGDTLDIDQDYTGDWSFPTTDQITITSSTNATLNLGSSDIEIFDWGNDSYTAISADAVSEGNREIPVSDPGAFSVGDDVRLIDDNDYYDGRTSWPSGSTLGTERPIGQYAVVEDVGSSTITIDRDTLQDYNDPSGTFYVERMDSWTNDDLIIENLNFIGHDDSDDGFVVSEAKNVTLRNCYWRYWGPYNSSSKDGSFASFSKCWHVTVRDCSGEDSGRYGWRMYNGTTDALVDNCETWRTGRYLALQSHGGSMHPTYDLLVTNCTAHDSESRAYDQHYACERMSVLDCEAENCQAFHLRGKDFYAENIYVHGDVGSDILRCRYKPEDVEIRNMTIEASASGDGVVVFDMDDPPALNFHMEDITFDESSDNGRTVDFRDSVSGTPKVDGFTAVNWEINGEMIETNQEFCDLADSYSSGSIENLDVYTT